MRARPAARVGRFPTERPAGLSRPSGRESLTQKRPAGGAWGITLTHPCQRNPSNNPRLSNRRAAPAALLPAPFARCAGGGAGLRETLKVPAPGAQRQGRCAGDGSCLIAHLTGCARRNGFRHLVRRASLAMHRCTRATGPGGYARLGSLSPALASSLRRVGRLRRAFVRGSAPHTPTFSRGMCDRCGGGVPARSGRHPARADTTRARGRAVRRVMVTDDAA